MESVASLGFQPRVYSSLMQRLLQSDKTLIPFHNGLVSVSSAIQFAEKRKASFPKENRKILVEAIQNQYNHLCQNEKVEINLAQLKKTNTVTVTTGHQLNIFTGPLFFWYKILDVINTAERLQKADKTHQYVPVFWMASEDHDFEEINHFFLGEQKVRWETKAGGPVGQIPTNNLNELHKQLEPFWNKTQSGKELLALFSDCYLNESNLANATRRLVHQLFGKYGLIVVDGNDPALKKLFVPTLLKEVKANITSKSVLQTNNALAKAIPNYKPQVNPREINLFYLGNYKRLRIVKNGQEYTTSDGAQVWSLKALETEIETQPERFSPNVLMRPLFQECVLPNIAYIGGGGELAYWLQLKTTFEAFEIAYPLLQHRSSVLLISEKQFKKCIKLNLPLQDLFLPKATFINKRVRQISDIDIDFTSKKTALIDHFEELKDLAKKTDVSFLGAVNAQEKKQLKGLENLEKRLLKAQRIKLQDQVIRLVDIRNVLFPNGKLQERTAHFSAVLSDKPLDVFTNELKHVLSDATGLQILKY